VNLQPKERRDSDRREPSAAEQQPKESEYFPQRRKGRKEKKYLSELRVLCALARGISESEMFHLSEHLRKLRKL